jgi:hypothetical protein
VTVRRWRFLTWRVGGRMRELRALPDVDGAEVVKVFWSLDNQHWLLLISRDQYAAGIGLYELWCLRLRDARMWRVTENTVRKAQWVGKKRIRYWVSQDLGHPEPHLVRRAPDPIYERDCVQQRPGNSHGVSKVYYARSAAASAYAVQHRGLGDDHGVIRAFNPRTGRTLWTRAVRRFVNITWSADGQALAVVDSWPDRVDGDPRQPIDRWRLFAWRVGERVRMSALSPLEGAHQVKEISWSPDNQRLLLLVSWGMGDSDAERFDLRCLRLRDGRMRQVTENAVEKAQWVGRKRIRYWVSSYEGCSEPPPIRQAPDPIQERDCD